jgi:uncharacterized protein YcgL (UPF0745 family)
MLSIEDTAYPYFKKNLTKKELKKIYTPTDDEISMSNIKKRGQFKKKVKSAQLCFLVMLKTFQRLGYFVQLCNVPKSIIKHIARTLKIKTDDIPDLLKYDQSKTRSRHMKEVRDYLKIQAYGDESKVIIKNAVFEASKTKEDLADIINVAIEELVYNKHELPAFSTLKRYAIGGRAKVNKEIYKKIYSNIGPESRERIDKLFVVSGNNESVWNYIKSEPGKLTKDNLKERITYYQWLSKYSVDEQALSNIPDVKIKQFSAEANSLNVTRMLELTENKRYALAEAFIFKKVSRTLDDFGDMLIKLILKIHAKGQKSLTEVNEQNRGTVDQLIDTFHKILIARKKGEDSIIRDQSELLILEGREDEFIKACENHAVYANKNYLPLLWKCYVPYRALLFKILNIVELETTTQDDNLLDAIHFLIEHQKNRKEFILIYNEQNDEIHQLLDLSWLSERWWKYIFGNSKSETIPKQVIRRNFEICIFHHLMLGLKSGDLYIKKSDKYSDYRTQLVSWKEYNKLIDQYGIQVNIPVEGEKFKNHIVNWFKKIGIEVDRAFPNNEYATIDNSEIVVKKSPKQKAANKPKPNFFSVPNQKIPNQVTKVDVKKFEEVRKARGVWLSMPVSEKRLYLSMLNKDGVTNEIDAYRIFLNEYMMKSEPQKVMQQAQYQGMRRI